MTSYKEEVPYRKGVILLTGQAGLEWPLPEEPAKAISCVCQHIVMDKGEK